MMPVGGGTYNLLSGGGVHITCFRYGPSILQAGPHQRKALNFGHVLCFSFFFFRLFGFLGAEFC